MTFQKRTVLFLLMSLVVISPILFGSNESWGAEKKSLTWATTASTSGVFAYFVGAAKILNEKLPEVNMTVRATGGGVHNTRLLEKREVDLGAMDSSTAWEADHGEGNFAGKPFKDLRMLYVSATYALQFAVSEKSGVKTVYDLEGKTICPGMLGGSTERTVVEIFKALGVRAKIRNMGYADAIEAMKNEQIAGFGKRGTPDSSVLDVMSSMKIRIISFSDEDIEKILKVVQGNRKVVVPAGVYQGIGAFKTIENEWADYVRKDFSSDLAYKIVKTIWENRADIKKSTPQFLADRLVEVSLGVNTNYMHPGAIRFYRELGYNVPKILIPPEMGEK